MDGIALGAIASAINHDRISWSRNCSNILWNAHKINPINYAYYYSCSNYSNQVFDIFLVAKRLTDGRVFYLENGCKKGSK